MGEANRRKQAGTMPQKTSKLRKVARKKLTEFEKMRLVHSLFPNYGK